MKLIKNIFRTSPEWSVFRIEHGLILKNLWPIKIRIVVVHVVLERAIEQVQLEFEYVQPVLERFEHLIGRGR